MKMSPADATAVRARRVFRRRELRGKRWDGEYFMAVAAPLT
jgi:hypothetical protein